MVYCLWLMDNLWFIECIVLVKLITLTINVDLTTINGNNPNLHLFELWNVKTVLKNWLQNFLMLIIKLEPDFFVQPRYTGTGILVSCPIVIL